MIQSAKVFQSNWQILDKGPGHIVDPLYFTGLGLMIGLIVGVVISIFRILKVHAYHFALDWVAEHAHTLWAVLLWLGVGLIAAIIVGFLIRNPAIRSGGAAWIGNLLENDNQPPLRKILLPKFLGSFLVLAFGVSVGSEGPCIQMGAATAIGLKKFDVKEATERHFFILAGCAAGLAAAFSAPFAGICYVYEIMNAKMSKRLLIFMLAGSLGIYCTCNQIFGLEMVLPLPAAAIPDLAYAWLLLPLAIFSGIVGIAYNYSLRWFISAYDYFKIIPTICRPVLPFLAAGLLVIYAPYMTGEGIEIFSRIEFVHVMGNFLFLYLFLKLFFTAFCYGSGIPAGMMVPILSLGGITGIIYADCLIFLGFDYPGWFQACLAMGMAGAFSATERAPVTGLVLVLEMTGAFGAIPGIFAVAAIASYVARLCNVDRL